MVRNFTDFGAVGRVATPKLSLPGFKLRAPRDREQRVDTSTSRVGGELLFRFFATPERGGDLTVPSLRLAFFSPRTGQYQIAETDPGLRGDTSGGGGKPATLETGAVVRVPLFVQQGEIIKVDTRTAEYLGRLGK